MRKKEDGTRQAASNGNGKTETGQPGKKPAAAKVLLDRDQSRIVVELVRRRLKKLAKKGQKKQIFAIGPGYAEVDGHDKIVVLTQKAVPAEEIDVAAAQKELDEAIKEGKDAAVREWAQARIDARNRA